jgi:hypothetical protein
MHRQVSFEDERGHILYIDNYNQLPAKDMKFIDLEEIGKKRQRVLFKIEEE